MTAIFISHSSADNVAADSVKAWLGSKGHTSLFLDFDPEAGIQAGSDWEQTLYQKLRQCQAVIALLTPNWLASKWCHAELVLAREKGKAIFPVKIQDCQAGGIFSDIQHIDLTARPDEGYRRLEIGLKACGLDPLDVFDWNPDRPPYPGLLAFQEEDAAIFFGRGEEILKTLETLETLRRQGRDAARFVLLLGASGSGKSSLARAGVIPRLHKQPTAWLPVPPFRPQEDPFEELAMALSTAFNRYGVPRAWDALRTELHRAAVQNPVDGRVLLDLARELAIAAKQPEATVLLTIDQTEELFGYSPPDTATRFLRLLRATLETADRRLLTLATMRSDFLVEFQNHPSLQDRSGEYTHHFRYQAVPVDPMPLRNFPAVIEGPARLAGLQLEQGLVEAMVRDTGTRDALPLLAFTLRRLYERYGQDGRLTIGEYEALGGLEGAIREEAERLLTEADPSAEDLEALHTAFVPTMVRINAEGGYARRRALLLDLQPRAVPLLQRFVDARLLVTDQDADGREIIEVAHEALLRTWPQLGDWLAEDQDNLRLLESLQRAAEDWDKGGQRPDLLIHRDGRLQDAEALLANPRFTVAEGSVESAYLDACSAAQRDREAAEKEAQERRIRDAERIAEEQKKAAVAHRKIAQRTRIGLAVAVALMAAAMLAGWTAIDQKRNAEQSEQTAQIQRLVVEADANLKTVPQQAGLLAVEAIKATQPGGEIVAAEQALRNALGTISGIGLSGHEGEVKATAIDRQGRWLVTGSQDGTARLWDLRAADPAQSARVLRGHERGITAVAFDPQGRWLVTGSEDATVRLWDLNAADPIPSVRVLRGHEGGITAVAFDPQGRRLVTGSEDATARLWDLSVDDPARNPRVLTGHRGGITAVALDPQGRWLATGSKDDTARLWDLNAADPTHSIQVLSGHQDAISAMALDPQGRWLVTGSLDKTARLWDLRAVDPARNSRVLTGHQDEITALAIDAQGRRLVTGSKDGTARLWELQVDNPNKTVSVLRGHEGGITAVAFDPQGRWLVTGGDDRVALQWNLSARDPAQDPYVLRGHEGGITAMAVDPEGRWLVTGSRDRTARLWDLRTIGPAQDPRLLHGHNDQITAMAIDPEGRWLVTGSKDGAVQRWELGVSAPSKSGYRLHEPENGITAMAIDPEGRWLVTGGEEGVARLWDLRAVDSAQNPRLLRGPKDGITAMAIDPEGRWLVTGSEEGVARLWDLRVSDPARQLQELYGHKGRIEAVAIDPQGHWLVTGSRDGTVRLWDLRATNPTESFVVLGAPKDWITAVAFDFQGRRLVTGSNDGAVQVWDLAAAERARSPRWLLSGHTDRITAIAFDPEGRWLVTGSRDRSARLWDLRAADPANSARVLGSLEHSIWAVAVDPKGRFVVTGNNSGTARLWTLPLHTMLGRIRQAIGRNLTEAEWEQYFPGKPYCPTFPELPVPTGVNVAEADCPKLELKKAVTSTTATSRVIPPATGTGALAAATSVSTEPAPAKAAPEEPTAAVTEPPAAPSRPAKPVASVPPAITESERQGRPSTAAPTAMMGTPSEAAVETKLEPVLSPPSVDPLSPATASVQPLSDKPVTPERVKEGKLKPSPEVTGKLTKRPAPRSAQISAEAKRQPAAGNGQSHSSGWQIKKEE
ncbi:MAG: TIR domain-containing protein [Candidatus Competibacteraceae bacterium]